MATITVTSKITHKYLMNKTKDEIVWMFMRYLDQIDDLNEIVSYVDDEIRPYLNRHGYLNNDPDAQNISDKLRPMLDDWRKTLE